MSYTYLTVRCEQRSGSGGRLCAAVSRILLEGCQHAASALSIQSIVLIVAIVIGAWFSLPEGAPEIRGGMQRN